MITKPETDLPWYIIRDDDEWDGLPTARIVNSKDEFITSIQCRNIPEWDSPITEEEIADAYFIVNTVNMRPKIVVFLKKISVNCCGLDYNEQAIDLLKELGEI